VRPDKVKIYRGRGCDDCNGSGFMGRCAIYEILRVDDDLRRLIMRNAPASEVKKAAVKAGMRTLRQDGWQKVIEGATTPEEILEVAEEDKDGSVPAPAANQEEVQSVRFSQAVKTAASDSKEKPLENHGRFFMRLNHTVNIQYRLLKGPDPADEAFDETPEESSFTKNISAGGLAFVAQNPIPAGTILDLKIELPGDDQPIQCLAKVMRVEGPDPGKAHVVAVCFLDLSASMRARLDKFVLKESK